MTDLHYISLATSSSYPARPGNRVRPLVGGVEIFRRIGEAIEVARYSIWATIAFFSEDFYFPDGRGTMFDVLDRAVARGVDVRLVIWRPNASAGGFPNMWRGDPVQFNWLAARNSKVKIRWDRASGKYCHHQKTWSIDVGHSSETSFVGGANITVPALRHQDIVIELTGPSASDVHHNFVERWNSASERTLTDGGWACDADDNLPLPAASAAPAGASVVQITRMMPAIGERSVVEQYQLAIGSARHTIYIENQAIPTMEIAEPLMRALERGVEVILLVPSTPEKYVFDARLDPHERPRFEGVEALARYPNFLMAGLGATYVHAKFMVVDDCWATVGSCNLHAFSLAGHSEMNAAIWDEKISLALRRKLFSRHLGVDTMALDQQAAFRLYRESAAVGRGVFSLDPYLYGKRQPGEKPTR